jgi:crossover junction endodeoxyribonuclease RuvC
MKVLGIDPGFAFIGLGLVEFSASSTRVLHHETHRSSSHDSDEERLDAIADHICDVIEHWQPDAIGYENQATVEAGKQARARRALEQGEEVASNFSSGRVHEVAGIIRASARFYAVPCYVLAVSTIKVAVLGKGGGRAKKDRVKGAVRTIFGLRQCSEHAADAIATAIAARSKHRAAKMLLASHANLIH